MGIEAKSLKICVGELVNAASPLVLVLQPHNKTGDRSFTCSIRSKFYSLLLVVVSNWCRSFNLLNQASGKNGSDRRHRVLCDTGTDLCSIHVYPDFNLPCQKATSRTHDEGVKGNSNIHVRTLAVLPCED